MVNNLLDTAFSEAVAYESHKENLYAEFGEGVEE